MGREVLEPFRRREKMSDTAPAKEELYTRAWHLQHCTVLSWYVYPVMYWIVLYCTVTLNQMSKTIL